MPTYEYECQKCHHHFEQFQSIKDEPIKRCPKCRGKTRRLVGTGAGLIFKGSGFYQTDYRSKSYVDAAKKDKTDSAGSTGGKSDGSGSKAETASPAKETKKTS